MMNDFAVDLLTVLGVLAGAGALLFLMTAVDPTNEQRRSPSHKAPRGTVTPTTLLGHRSTTKAPTEVTPVVRPLPNGLGARATAGGE